MQLYTQLQLPLDYPPTNSAGDTAQVVYHYHDCVVDYAAEPQMHHYPCRSTACIYCQKVALGMLRAEYTLADFISFEEFVAAFPKLLSSHSVSEDLSYTDLLKPEEEEEEEDLGVQIGYTPEPLEAPVDIFAAIDFERLYVIGAGQYGIVLGDGTYVIKVGSIRNNEELVVASRAGLAPPIFYHATRQPLDPRLYRVLQAQKYNIYRMGNPVELTQYICSDGTADILVAGCASLVADHETCDGEEEDYDEETGEVSFTYKVLDALAKRCQELTSLVWYDRHPYNIGKYKGGYVILDF